MDYLLIAAASLLASFLTFFSGFGLGTLLLPVFLLFFPPTPAIAATAIVHLVNNFFKAGVMGKHAHIRTLLAFAPAAILGAIAGAFLLKYLSGLPIVAEYTLLQTTFHVTPLKLLIGSLMGLFAWLELSPTYGNLAFPPRMLPLGGLLSGFFGGLSGHQGALRSAFLVRQGLEKEAFIATNVLAAVIVDIVRLPVYGYNLYNRQVFSPEQAALLGLGCLSAIAGVILATRFLNKVTMDLIRKLVGVLLIVYAALLAAGLI